MSPLERLLAEEWPTGTFGDAHAPHAPAQARQSPQWTPAEQAAHVADLLAELDRHDGRGTSHHPAPARARRLRAVPNAA